MGLGVVKDLWEWIQLGRKGAAVKGAMENADTANGYNPGTTLKKVAVALGQLVGSAALAAAGEAALVALSNEDAVRAVLTAAGVGPDVQKPLTLLIFAAVVGINNYRKNRKK
jgi:hypothetical protein